MAISFRALVNYSAVVYLDDVIVFSKHRSGHIFYLRKVFERCGKYGVSLNPKMRIFSITQGILLGCVVSKHGIMIDPERTQAISKTTYPTSKKAMQ